MSSPDDHTSILSVIFTPEDKPEPQHLYESGGYHPVVVGEVYNQRYKVVRKLGWGRYSTVWLVRDTQNQTMAALKVLVAVLSDNEKNGTWDELGMLKVIHERNPQSDGYRHICQLLDNFTHQGPNGTHICLVLEVMRLNVLSLEDAFSLVMPFPLLARLSKHLLRALQYLHDECGIIHTDIKGDNILMAGDPPESTVTLNEDDFSHATLKLSDFGAANLMSNRATGLIQPESLRAPEVLIGAEWDTKVDIWNLGCLICEFATGLTLFRPHLDNEKNQLDPVETHLAQLVCLCGDFPPKFLERGSESKLYFDDKGSLLRGTGIFSTTLIELLGPALIARHSMDIDDIVVFLEFLCLTLTLDPRDRPPARELLNHPWVGGVE